MLKPLANADEPKSATSVDGGAVAGSPGPEKPAEPAVVKTETTAKTAT